MKTAITIPPLGESVEQATIIEWMKKEGDVIHQDDMLLTLETDKVTLEVYAPTDGVLVAIDCAAESVVESGSVVGFIQSGDQAKGSAKTRMTPQASPITSEKKPQKVVKPKKVTKPQKPIVTRNVSNGAVDDDHTLDWLLREPTEPKVSSSPSRGEHKLPLTPLRRRIAARLKDAQNQAAILTTFNEVDMSAVMALRREHGEDFEKRHGVRLGYMGLFVCGCTHALRCYPMVNSYFADDGITQHDYCDIGIAISVPQGLVVPVLRDTHAMGVADVEKAIVSYAKAAQEGKLKPQDLRGGTFTITNGGVFGSMLSTPILNPPQSAILGMHTITERAMVVEGSVVVRPMMYLALSYDHRILDGKDAVLFLRHVKESIEKPQKLLLSL